MSLREEMAKTHFVPPDGVNTLCGFGAPAISSL